MIACEWKICVKGHIKFTVGSTNDGLSSRPITIPAFETVERGRVLFKSYLIHKELASGRKLGEIPDPEVAYVTHPLTMTDVCFTLPDLHTGVEPF